MTVQSSVAELLINLDRKVRRAWGGEDDLKFSPKHRAAWALIGLVTRVAEPKIPLVSRTTTDIQAFQSIEWAVYRTSRLTVV